MADPVTILCSILTISDASKKVLDVCTEYIAHAKNAPKEFQAIIHEVHALNGTMKRLDNLAKSARRTSQNADQFDEWELPLKRLKSYAEELVEFITGLTSRQELKIGLFHELRFRTRWSHHWRAANRLLCDIRREKDEFQFAAQVYGA